MHYIGYVGNLVKRRRHTAEHLLHSTLQLLGKRFLVFFVVWVFLIFLMVAPLVGFFLQFIEQGAERVSMVAKCIGIIMASSVSTELLEIDIGIATALLCISKKCSKCSIVAII